MKKIQLRNIIKEEISNILEGKQPSKLHITHTVPGGRLYNVYVEFKDSSKEKFRTLEDAEAKYDLKGVKKEYWEMDVS
tara:strand:+ start:142 stop:375 length:234 start_codon:yes stop_codon:yes gene_type:complete